MNLVVVFFTVVVNGMTMAPLMRMLNMTVIPEDRRFQLNTAYLQLTKDSESYFKKLKQHQMLEFIINPTPSRLRRVY